jgi:hypothetical protein
MARKGQGLLSGWEPLPGTPRNIRAYVNRDTGEVVSKHQYQKAVNLSRYGESSKEKLAEQRVKGERPEPPGLGGRLRREDRWLAEVYKKEHKTASSKEVHRMTREIGIGFRTVNPNDRSRKGPLAKLLVKLGRRQATDRWRVGESPGKGRKR